nr:hypothetical protein [Tanacetum cinerariifolium]
SPRVPVPFLKDLYEAIRQACLVEMDTESEPFEDPVETETLESPHTVASPTSLPDSTPPTRHVKESEDSDTSGVRSTPSDFTTPLSPDHLLTHTSPTLVLFLDKTTRMAMRVPPAMSLGLSASITEVAVMFDSTFCKRFRSSYETSPSSPPPDLLLRKHSRGTSKLVEDDKEEDEEEEDEEVEESLDSDSESEDAREEGLAMRDEGTVMRVASLGFRGDEDVPEVQQRAASVVETAVGEPLGLGYGALRHQEIASREGQMPSVFDVDLEDSRAYIDVPTYPPLSPPVQTPPSPEWSSGSLSGSLVPFVVPSPISSSMIPQTIPSPVASPATAEAKGFLTELRAQVKMQGGLIHDHTVRSGELSPALFERYDRDTWELFNRLEAVRDEIFSQRYRLKSLKHEHERVVRAALWHASGDTQMENRESRLQIKKERRARLDLAKIVASMRRGQEPRGDV